MDMPKPPQPPIMPKKPGIGMPPPPAPQQRTKAFIPPKPGPAAVPVHDQSMAGVLDRIEERSNDMMESKHMLQEQLKKLEQKLHEEREKALLATMRSKEESALSSKVELSLKEMQEKMQWEKRERELEEAYRSAREECASLEEKLRIERETWMRTLQEQIGGKEQQEQELELFFSQKLSDLERKWNDEKNSLLSQIRSKDEELNHSSTRHAAEIDKVTFEYERQKQELQQQLEMQLHEEKERSLQRKRELDLASENLNEKEQEFVALKAQLALMHSQMKLEKEKLNQTWLEQMRLKEEEVKTLKSHLERFDVERDKVVKDAVSEIERQYAGKHETLVRDIEHERKKYADTETELRIKLAEADARRISAEEKLQDLQKDIAQFDPALVDNFKGEIERYRERVQELIRERETHGRERDIWKQSLQEIEQKLEKQHQEWDQTFSQERLRLRTTQERLEQKDSQIKQIEAEKKSIEEKYWNERDGWSRITSEKDDDVARLFERVDRMTQDMKQQEAQYAEMLKKKEEELAEERRKTIEIIHEREAHLWEEQRKWDEQLKLKEQQFMKEEEKYRELLSQRDREMLREKENLLGVLRQKELENAKADDLIRSKEKEFEEERNLYEDMLKEKEREVATMKEQHQEHFRSKDIEQKLQTETKRVEDIVKEKNNKWQDNRQYYEEIIREKERETSSLKAALNEAPLKIRQQVEQEFKAVTVQIQKDNHEWAERVRKEYEEKTTQKERMLRDELRSIHKKTIQDLELLEHEHQQEKARMQDQRASKEKELIQTVKNIEDKYGKEADTLRRELQKRNTQVETLQRNASQQSAERLQGAIEQKLDVKIKEIEQLQRRAIDASMDHQKEIAGLTQKFHEELSGLERRIVRSQEPKTLLGKLWLYLNRTVIIISLRRSARYNG